MIFFLRILERLEHLLVGPHRIDGVIRSGVLVLSPRVVVVVAVALPDSSACCLNTFTDRHFLIIIKNETRNPRKVKVETQGSYRLLPREQELSA